MHLSEVIKLFILPLQLFDREEQEMALANMMQEESTQRNQVQFQFVVC
jgi:hypothetical protein